MNDKITMIWDKPMADALTRLLALLRPDWQPPGIAAALADQRLRAKPPTEVALAAIRAGANSKIRTPAVIPLDGEHWNGDVPVEHRDRPLPPAYKPDILPLSADEREAAALALAGAKSTLAAVRGTTWCPRCGMSVANGAWADHQCREGA